jgi:hypothetical protein
LYRKPFQKRLERKPEKRLSLSTLFPNPIGVINRRNGFGTTFAAQRFRLNASLFEKCLMKTPGKGLINRLNARRSKLCSEGTGAG